MLHKAKAKLKQEIQKRSGAKLVKPSNLLFLGDHGLKDTPEAFFETSDGREIPVFKNHRYNLKPGWNTLGPLAALFELDNKNLLSAETKKFLDHAKGYRTPLVSMDEVMENLTPYLDKHESLFLSKNMPDVGKRLMKPSKNEVLNLINNKAKEHSYLLEKIRGLVDAPPVSGERAMEIGYTSGGESIIGLERAGMQAIGIDNFYHSAVETVNRHEYIANIADSRAEFLVGDITKKTEIEDESVSYIFSLSVMEHITDIEASFQEMHRILRPGGVMFHRYDPYFHIKGGHSVCILDSPWAHMRMSQDDVKRYIREFRPYEADAIIPWIESALNRKHTQGNVQQLLSRQGFNIRSWEAIAVSPQDYSSLTSDIVRDCLNVNEGVTLNDIVTGAVAFIAEKPL